MQHISSVLFLEVAGVVLCLIPESVSAISLDRTLASCTTSALINSIIRTLHPITLSKAPNTEHRSAVLSAASMRFGIPPYSFSFPSNTPAPQFFAPTRILPSNQFLSSKHLCLAQPTTFDSSWRPQARARGKISKLVNFPVHINQARITPPYQPQCPLHLLLLVLEKIVEV
jgi:hypothetical protein